MRFKLRRQLSIVLRTVNYFTKGTLHLSFYFCFQPSSTHFNTDCPRLTTGFPFDSHIVSRCCRKSEVPSEGRRLKLLPTLFYRLYVALLLSFPSLNNFLLFLLSPPSSLFLLLAMLGRNEIKYRLYRYTSYYICSVHLLYRSKFFYHQPLQNN